MKESGEGWHQLQFDCSFHMCYQCDYMHLIQDIWKDTLKKSQTLFCCPMKEPGKWFQFPTPRSVDQMLQILSDKRNSSSPPQPLPFVAYLFWWYPSRKWKSVELVNLVTFTVEYCQEVSSTKAVRASTSRTLLWDWLFDQIHCAHMGPHLGDPVPMGTFFSFWVPIGSPFLFQGPHFH